MKFEINGLKKIISRDEETRRLDKERMEKIIQQLFQGLVGEVKKVQESVDIKLTKIEQLETQVYFFLFFSLFLLFFIEIKKIISK